VFVNLQAVFAVLNIVVEAKECNARNDDSITAADK
jgi:hypothetical protein